MKNVIFDWKARLRELRKKKGLTQKDLAKLCGVSQATISQYETEARSGTIEGLAIILDGLHVSFAEFFCGCHERKRCTDPADFNPSQLRKRSLRIVKSSPTK